MREKTYTILEGVVGSTAYGLAREGSDEDRLGIWLEPTRNVVSLGWNWHKATMVWKAPDPDRTLHELEKYLHLALSGNPTLVELLWLDDYVTQTWVGQKLIEHRGRLLSTSNVRNSYLGYARQQAHKLRERGGLVTFDTMAREWKELSIKISQQSTELIFQISELGDSEKVAELNDNINFLLDQLRSLQTSVRKAEKNEGAVGSFDSDTKNRTAKHARHCLRLARQGAHLLKTGEVVLKVDDPEEYWAFDNMHWQEMLDKLETECDKLADIESVLPEQPDRSFINAFLADVRKENW